MNDWWLITVRGKDYILDDALRVQLMRFLVGDIEKIPGLDFGPPPMSTPTELEWDFFFRGIGRELPISDSARREVEKVYPHLMDKMDALWEAVRRASSMPAIDEAFEVAKIKRFHERRVEKLVVESWNNLREMLIKKYLRFHMDELKGLWFSDRMYILDELLKRYGLKEPAKMRMQGQNLGNDQWEYQSSNSNIKYKRSGKIIWLIDDDGMKRCKEEGRKAVKRLAELDSKRRILPIFLSTFSQIHLMSVMPPQKLGLQDKAYRIHVALNLGFGKEPLERVYVMRLQEGENPEPTNKPSDIMLGTVPLGYGKNWEMVIWPKRIDNEFKNFREEGYDIKGI